MCGAVMFVTKLKGHVCACHGACVCECAQAVWKSYEVLNILDGNLMTSSVSYTHTCPCSSTGNSPKGRRLHAHVCVHE
jgi:hypothetical protein